MMNDSFREDYRPGAGSATVHDGNTDTVVIQNIWILLRIVESKNREALLLTGGGGLQVGFGTQEVFHNVKSFAEERITRLLKSCSAF